MRMASLLSLLISGIASAQTFNVKLEKAEAIELCKHSDEVIFILDEQRCKDPNRRDGDGNYWRFGGDRPTTRTIGLNCLKGKPVNSSFILRVGQLSGQRLDSSVRLSLGPDLVGSLFSE